MLSAPEEYDLDVARTLAFRARVDEPEGFEAHWAVVREAIESLPARLAGAGGNAMDEVSWRSLDDVRIAGWLHRPPGALVGGVVMVHGHRLEPETEETIADALLARGLAVLRVRLRGFGPSAVDLDDPGDAWILHGIETSATWIVRGAVVDIATAYLGLRRHLGGDVPVGLFGSALGGGLATIAAAQLARLDEPPVRLAVSLPDLGAWSWRAGRYCSGPGGLVNMVLEAQREEGPALLDALRLYDAALHAARTPGPVLCHLAERDDVVPAPAAAAVANAFSGPTTDPFVTRFGHFDGGLADARRKAELPGRLAGFLDPTGDPA